MKEDIYTEVMDYLYTMTHQMDEDYHKAARYFHLSDCELDILYSFSILDAPRTQRALCQENYVSKQTMSSALQKMEKRGWINYTSGADRREKLIQLTEEGRKARERTTDLLLQADYKAMSSVSRTDAEAVLASLKEYKAAFHQSYQDLFDRKEIERKNNETD